MLPVNVAQTQGREVLESIREFRLLCDPAPQTTIGLSNVSQGTKFRPLVNRTFLTMAIANGLTSAILRPARQRADGRDDHRRADIEQGDIL